MRTQQLPDFNVLRPAEEQFAEHFATCGLNADWGVTAFHLSGGRPNVASGDFYLLQNEESAGGWKVVIRTCKDDRPDRLTADAGQDLIEEVQEFDDAASAWAWLQDPVSQAFYLHASEPELNAARGILPARSRLYETGDLSGARKTLAKAEDRA